MATVKRYPGVAQVVRQGEKLGAGLETVRVSSGELLGAACGPGRALRAGTALGVGSCACGNTSPLARQGIPTQDIVYILSY